MDDINDYNTSNDAQVISKCDTGYKDLNKSELNALKEEALVFFSKYGVNRHLEMVLNNLFYDSPPDVFGYISNYFSEVALKPTIFELESSKICSKLGDETFTVKVICSSKNQTIPLNQSIDLFVPPEVSKVEEWDELDRARNESIDIALGVLQSEISTRLKGKPLLSQKALDDELDLWFNDKLQEMATASLKSIDDLNASSPASGRSSNKSASPTAGDKKKRSPARKKSPAKNPPPPTTPPEIMPPGHVAVSMVSSAICSSACNFLQRPAFEYLRQSFCPDLEVSSLPYPIVCLIQSGKAFSGKLNCVKEFCIVPSFSLTIVQAVHGIVRIDRELKRAMSLKGGLSARCSSPNGSISMTLDRPDQALDLIQEAIVKSGFEAGDQFTIGLNCGMCGIFDDERGRYDMIGGQQKGGSVDDALDFWVDLLKKYPTIAMLIDPFRKEDKAQWKALQEKATELALPCKFWSTSFQRPGLVSAETEFPEEFHNVQSLLRLEGVNTISHLMGCAFIMRNQGHEVAFAACEHPNESALGLDLAVASAATYVKFGGIALCASELERLAGVCKQLKLDGGGEAGDVVGVEEAVIGPEIEDVSNVNEEQEGTSEEVAPGNGK